MNLEQVPKEQLPLDLGDHEEQMKPLVPETNEIDIEALTDGELETLYHKAVGKDPKPRSLNRVQLIAGIHDPAAELERLAEIDRESDKEDLVRPYITH